MSTATATLACHNFHDAADAPAMQLEDWQTFSTAMGRACTGVTIVSTDGAAGRFGATVHAMSPVSADPPLLLVSVSRCNLLAPAIDRNQSFCVNVLDAEHQDLSRIFAGQLPADGGDRFEGADWHQEVTGAPVFSDALAAFDCYVQDKFELGTHTVYVGLVMRANSRDGTPLLYHGHRYCQPLPLDLGKHQ